jgi:pimeloyl-ACP methyl ester carboxylesterase
VVELAMHEWSQTGPGIRAPSAVLVHGVTGWWRTWWRVGPALAERGWHVVGVDLRGHGGSPRIDGAVTVPELADDLIATLENLAPPVDLLLGHSLGAAVATDAAARRPDLLRRLVLEDPPSINRAGDTAWLANLERELSDARQSPEDEIARELSENPAWLPEDARQDVEGRRMADAAGILASMRQPTGARVGEIVPGLAMPTLVILGGEARSVFAGDARRRLTDELPPSARLVVIDAAGHTVHRDRYDEYFAALLGWLGDAPST